LKNGGILQTRIVFPNKEGLMIEVKAWVDICPLINYSSYCLPELEDKEQ